MTNRPAPYSPEVGASAVRMVLAHQAEHASQWAAINSIVALIGCSSETLRNWIRQSERAEGLRGGPSTGLTHQGLPRTDRTPRRTLQLRVFGRRFDAVGGSGVIGPAF